jgi:nucleotide-binding universal stress UspA family protein
MSFRRILMPFDHVTDVTAASAYVRQIGFVMNADVFLLHVTTDPSAPVLVRPNSEVITVRAGNPANEIVQYAEEVNADLIVMPSRRHGIVRQLLFGSTTMDVIRNTGRSVWIASSRSLKPPVCFSCQRIICAIDTGKEASTVLKCASDLAVTWNADLVVVDASDRIAEATSIGYGRPETNGTALLPQIVICRLIERALPKEVPVAVEVTTGDVAEVLRKVAREKRADLVVIGRGIHTAPLQFGANIVDIISRIQCPVLTCDGRRSGMDVELALFGSRCLLSDT